jgi:hypothetical protein
MSVFKRLAAGAHLVEPFEVNASQSFAWISGSVTSSLSGSGFSINLANAPPTNYPRSNLSNVDDLSEVVSTLGGSTDGGFYSYPLYHSAKSYFYIDSASFSDVYEFFPSGSMFVWNVGSNYVGEGIKQDTFKVELDGNTLSVQDDGNGKLKLNGTGSVVGNIFYHHGIAAVQRNMSASGHLISSDGISISGSAGVTSSFQSIVNIYEHTIGCKIKPTEFNTTFNPTIFYTASSGTGSYNDQMISGSTLPYVTTIGLYNDINELVAVAKLSKPITRMKHTSQTFVVRFDE